MKRRLRKKRSREALDLALVDLTCDGFGENHFVNEGHDELYVPSPSYAAEYCRLGVSLRVKVTTTMSDAAWVEVYSPEFPLIAQEMLMFWGELAETVFSDQ